MDKINLSIIIVNFNTKNITEECILSVLNTVNNINYEIILVDNSTSEAERVLINDSHIKYFVTTNKGYANANNVGVSKSSGEYILFLNPDTIVYENTINNCLSYMMQNQQIGALGCKILRPDGSLDHACRRGFPTPFNSLCYFTKLYKIFKHNPKVCRYTFSHLDVSISCEVDSLTGAFMMVSNTILQSVGVFDEAFFMYGEDIDLCYRIKSSGYKIYYYADYTILHKKYQSGIAKSSSFVIKQFYKSMTLFFDKHYKNKYNFLVTGLVHLGVNSIMGIKLLINKFK